MLEERTTHHRRVGSARSGSTSFRVGSARQASGRIGSARPSSDTRRPKLHTGRPSSAPPGRSTGPVTAGWTPPRLPGPFRTHDVSHLNLKVEGKSIRSVSYTPRRHQPVNRGSVRVVSSHGYTVSGRRRQFLSSHKVGAFENQELGSELESLARTGFGSTYTLPLSADQPRLYRDDVSFGQLDFKKTRPGGTFTKEEAKVFIEDRLGGTYTLKSGVGMVKEQDFDQLVRNNDRDDASHYHHHHQHSSSDSDQRTFTIDNSGSYAKSEYNIRPQVPIGSRGDVQPTGETPGGFICQMVKRGEIDTTSNEDSESTVMSLGRKIQLMATSPSPPQDLSHPEEKDENWDTEWKQLLKQNHELLLKLSSREDLRSLESITESPKSVSVHDSAIQTVPCTVDEDEAEEPLHLDIDVNEDIRVKEEQLAVKSPECVLEDIIEESSLSDKSSPRTIINYKSVVKEASLMPNTYPLSNKNDVDRDSAHMAPHTHHGMPGSAGETSPITKTASDNSRKSPSPLEQTSDCTTKTSPALEKNLLAKPDVTGTRSKGSVSHSDPTYIDSSCTADLPSYRAGAVTTYLVRSRFSSKEKQDRQIRLQPSKDLLEALRMIEDEEKKVSEPIDEGRLLEAVEGGGTQSHVRHSIDPGGIPATHTPNPMNWSPTLVGDGRGTTTLPVLQVLVEKVFLFTQDLAERWQLVDNLECHEDLLCQLVEAERLLEEICVREGRKQDPQRNPNLHLKCEEKARKMQEESEARIQKNIELIRKLMDDKKRLTEQCEELYHKQKMTEKRLSDKVKAVEERHNQELKNLKEKITVAEQEKRERWTQQKTKAIKETTYKGLETKLKDLNAKHRDDLSLLKAQHWEALKEAEEKHRSQLHAQEEELRRKCEQEKEEACRREREREQQRLEVELRQNEQLALTRMESVRKQQEKDLKALIEEHQNAQEKLRRELEGALREAEREKNRLKEECEDKVHSLTRTHQEELASLQQREERNRNEWKEQFTRQEAAARQQAEKELRERLKRQRDKEIERAIREIQAETSTREEEDHRNFDAKVKNLRERYESELNELECAERAARTRYLEIKSLLAQKEEETVYLRARLHTQDLELCDLQHMLQPPDG